MKLKTIMQDRPDLIVSELSGLAFDSLQCVFRPADLDIMFTQRAPDPELNGDVWLFIDPAAGGPQSDYAILSFTRHKGLVTVRCHVSFLVVCMILRFLGGGRTAVVIITSTVEFSGCSGTCMYKTSFVTQYVRSPL